MASVLGCSGMLMKSSRRLPRDANWRHCAILSNGGFGGIYEKLPARFASGGEAAAVDSARRGKLMKHFHSRHASMQQIIQIILLLLVIVVAAAPSRITRSLLQVLNSIS